MTDENYITEIMKFAIKHCRPYQAQTFSPTMLSGTNAEAQVEKHLRLDHHLKVCERRGLIEYSNSGDLIMPTIKVTEEGYKRYSAE